jgi:hypothetical protein
MKYFTDLKNILPIIATRYLPLPDPASLSNNELQGYLQSMSIAFLPLFDNMPPVRIILKEELEVDIEKKPRKAAGCYVLEKDDILISAEYLASCRQVSAWIGLVLHEMTHAYVARMYYQRRNYKARCAFAWNHNVWFFEKVLEIQAALNGILYVLTWWQDVCGHIELHLRAVLDEFPALERRYDSHLQKATRRSGWPSLEIQGVASPAKVERNPASEINSLQSLQTYDEDAEDLERNCEDVSPKEPDLCSIAEAFCRGLRCAAEIYWCDFGDDDLEGWPVFV